MIKMESNNNLNNNYESSDYKDGSSSDQQSLRKYDNIIAYDTDDEENNHIILENCHNNMIENINKDIHLIPMTSSSDSDSEVEVHKRKKKIKEDGKNKMCQKKFLEQNINVNGKMIDEKIIKESCSSKCRSK